jgi:transposase InsO family protein
MSDSNTDADVRILSVPPRRKHKRIRNVAPPREVTADRPNAVWCLDFVQDNTPGGTKLRILSVTDEFTRESLALEVGGSFRSEQERAGL